MAWVNGFGNNITEVNADLVPERLYGAEVGGGGEAGVLRWSATAFYNRLEDAVTNVTVGFGPFLDPVAGFIPAGGVLFQRRNVGRWTPGGGGGRRRPSWRNADRPGRDRLDPRPLDGGSAAPQLTGLAPAETPRFSATGSLAWRAAPKLKLTADLRYESARFDDDLNLRRLGRRPLSTPARNGG